MNTRHFIFLYLVLNATLAMAQTGVHTTYYYQRETHFQTLPHAPHAIVFAGNSITDGGEWPELFPGRTVLNRGISGDISQGVLDRLPTILAGNPEKIFLMIGVNDLARGMTVDQVMTNYRAMLTLIRQRTPLAELYIQSVLPVNDQFDRFSTHVNKGSLIRELNSRLEALCRQNGAVYLDLYTPFCGLDQRLDTRYTNDGLHLNGTGYQLWKSLVFPFVYSLNNAKPALIPYPRQLNWAEARFELGKPTEILASDPALQPLVEHLKSWWPGPLGVAGSANQIVLELGRVVVSQNPEEAYTLEVDGASIRLRATTPHGLFNGLQTLRQLARDGVFVPGCQILDWPAFAWRGVMHDVGRNFQSLSALKSQIDLLSRYKLNVFHFHLTEDIAWRLESKKYPALTKPEHMIRNPGQYYSQEELKDLIAYCRERFVTLVPELDMPGHSAAFTRATGYDMQSPEGRRIVADLLHEFCQTFDVPIIHLGSDEVRIRDQEFMPEMVRIVRSYNKEVMGWKPGGNLPGSVIRQLWLGQEMPDNKGRFIDSRHLYLNHLDPLESVVTIFQRRIGGLAETDGHVLGAIACVWPDRRVAREEEVLTMNGFYPALLTLMERSWQGGGQAGYRSDFGQPSSAEAKAFAAFESRLLDHQRLYFQGLPFPYVEQSTLHWKLAGPFENVGNTAQVFWPEMTPEKLDSIPPAMALSGATIWLRHFWAPLIGSHLPDPKPNQTYYAWIDIQSPVDRTVYLWAGFNNLSRSHAADTPPAGKWDEKGSRIWLNGQEVSAPAWARPGRTGLPEDPLIDEGYEYRDPTPVRLKAGPNRVLVKVPVAGFQGKNGQNPVKWMFTAVLIEPGSAGWKGVE